MVTNEFADASAELIEVLKYLPKTEVEKIPLKLRQFFENVANKNYSVKIDPYKTLEQQNLKEKTKDLIAVIYRNYWCSKEERKSLDAKLIENDKRHEEELKEKYNIDHLFKQKKVETVQNSVAITEYKESFWTKIKNWLFRNFTQININ